MNIAQSDIQLKAMKKFIKLRNNSIFGSFIIYY